MSKKQNTKFITPDILKGAVKGAFIKLNPRYMMKNPVMFVVEIGFFITLLLSFVPGLFGDANAEQLRIYDIIVCAILFVTVLFAPPMKIADNMGSAPAGLGEDQLPGSLLLQPGLDRRRRVREVRPRQGFHRLSKRKALDLNEIVQGRFPADFAGEPVPFSVADLQAVMLTGAVGASAHMDELVRVIPLEIGQQVPFLSLGDLLRGDIAHPTVPPAGPFPFQPV